MYALVHFFLSLPILSNFLIFSTMILVVLLFGILSLLVIRFWLEGKF